MASVDTALLIVDAINKVVELYEEVESAKDEANSIVEQFEGMATRFKLIELRLKGKGKPVDQSAEKHLQDLLNKVHHKCQTVLRILERVKNRNVTDDSSPLKEVKFRFEFVAWVVYTWGKNGRKEVQKEINEIEKLRADIDSMVQQLTFDNTEEMLRLFKEWKAKQEKEADARRKANKKREEEETRRTAKAKATATATARKGEQGKGAGGDPTMQLHPPPASGGFHGSPSPSPRRPRKDYAVIFVDPYDAGRSVIAQGIMELQKHWTRAGGKEFPVARWSSAGFFVRSRCDCVAEIEGMSYKTPTYKKNMEQGGVVTDKVACDALFYKGAYTQVPAERKAEVEARIRAHKSTGLRRADWARYDYFLCFTYREYDNLVRLKRAILEKDGKDACPRGKGGIVHLGRYLAKEGEQPKEILAVLKGKDSLEDRVNWNTRVAELKTGVRDFLSEEVQWRPPELEDFRKEKEKKEREEKGKKEREKTKKVV